MSLSAILANGAWRCANWSDADRFTHALRDPAGVQRALLAGYLRRAEQTRFGREHGLSESLLPREYSERVPVRRYEDYAPWLEQIARGQPRVLTTDVVERFVPTSGSTSGSKMIPYTSRLKREFSRALAPWINDLFDQEPSIAAGPAYWSISPATRRDDERFGVLPVGFEDDSAYLGAIARRIAGSVLAVPSQLRLASDMATWRSLTLLCLLRRRDLRFISVWHPSFLMLLADAAAGCWESLLSDIARGTCLPDSTLDPRVREALKDTCVPAAARAQELRSMGAGSPHLWWPDLRVVSCWGDAASAMGAASLAQRWPGALVQHKGLLATEGVVSIPYRGMHPLAVTSHYLEFIESSGRVRTAAELEQGGVYEVVVTTGGGLYRYTMEDQVIVDGFVERTPSVRFLGRRNAGVDLCGEKLTESFVASCFMEFLKATDRPIRFAMMAVDGRRGGRAYTLFIEGGFPDESMRRRLDELLGRNPHYAYARALGQLGDLAIWEIPSGANEAYFRAQQERGLKLGDIKPTALSASTDWSERFSGGYVGDVEAMARGLQNQ